MKCGKGHDHQNAADVRACYAQRNGGTYFSAAPAAFRAGLTTTVELPPPPTDWSPDADAYWDRQMQLKERREDEAVAEFKRRRDEGLNAHAAPTVERDRTGRAPRPAPRENLRALFSVITPGYYATPSRTGNNDLDFWWVQKPTEGRWAGLTFVKRIVGGRAPIQIPKGLQIAVAKDLAKLTPAERAASQATFAEELGRCYRCGRTLTDETSRALGIGPDCRNK